MGTTATVLVDLDPPFLIPNQPDTAVRPTEDGALLAVADDNVVVEFSFRSLAALLEWADAIVTDAQAEIDQPQERAS